jgi:hypothetical protein
MIHFTHRHLIWVRLCGSSSFMFHAVLTRVAELGLDHISQSWQAHALSWVLGQGFGLGPQSLLT